MIDIVNKEDCVLCGSCVNVCPKEAISYKARYYDFQYPVIDPEKCVKCNLCQKVCPVLLNEDNREIGFPKAYIGRVADRDTRMNSTSGGFFSALSEFVLSKGGYVCGAVLTDDFHVQHVVSADRTIVQLMRGSKYAQSDMKLVMREVKNLLHAGKKVLFSGCPCQIAGIRAYLKEIPDSLILMEVVCHGIPSDKMLQSYLNVQREKMQADITSLEFRNKEKGWHRSAVHIEFSNGRIYHRPITVDAYMAGFLRNTTLKSSCYHCRFRNFRSGSDFTVADFWGAEVEMPDLDDNTGLSAIMVNTQKGLKIIQKLRLELYKGDLEKIIHYNSNITKSAEVNPNRMPFYYFAEENGYPEAIKEFLWEKPCQKAKRILRYLLRVCKHRILGKGKTLY